MLTVDCYDSSSSLANGASTDERQYVEAGDRHHRESTVRSEPVGLVVAAGVVADFVLVTEYERHGTETWQTGAGITCKCE